MTTMMKELQWDARMGCYFVAVYQVNGDTTKHIGTRHLTPTDRRDFADHLTEGVSHETKQRVRLYRKV